LEDRETPTNKNTSTDGQAQETPSWSTILRRKKKKRDSSQVKLGRETSQDRREEDTRREKEKEEEERKKRKIKTLKRRFSKGAGVLMKLQGGTPMDYEEIVRRCQKEISLEEMGIPHRNQKSEGRGEFLRKCNAKT